MDILTRLLIALVLVGLGLLAYTAWNRWQLRRLRPPAPGTPGARAHAPGLEAWQAGRPAILYFTTPECAPCRTMQRPALERLRADLGPQLQVIEVDAGAQTAVADHWGVLAVPTTFVLDAGGAPRHINHGVAGAEKLKRQLARTSSEGPGNEGPRTKDYTLNLNP